MNKRALLERARRRCALVGLVCALALALASGGCGGGGGGGGSNGGTAIPMGTVCVPLGFGAVSFDLTCAAGAGGADRQCTFTFASSNTGVVAISPSVVVVPENTTLHVVLTTIGNSIGTSTLTGDSDNGPPFTVGKIRVGC